MRRSQLYPSSQKWFPFEAGGGSMEVLVNRFIPDEAERLQQKYKRLDRDGVERIDMRRWYEFLAKEVLAGWRGYTEDDDVTAVEFSESERLKAVRTIGSFASFLAQHFTDEDAFRGNAPGEPDSPTTGEPLH